MLKTVLVVDDHTLVTEAMSLLLEDDYNLASFDTPACGKYVLEWLDTHQPDYAVLDILINGISGVEIAQKILKLYPTCPILFVTGCAEENEKFQEAHAMTQEHQHIGLYRKPYDPAYKVPLPTFLTAKLAEVL